MLLHIGVDAHKVPKRLLCMLMTCLEMPFHYIILLTHSTIGAEHSMMHSRQGVEAQATFLDHDSALAVQGSEQIAHQYLSEQAVLPQHLHLEALTSFLVSWLD